MEVCVDNIESALNAERAGASRIELCSALGEGGLTPTVGFLKMTKKLVKIPVFVMIRPRSGDFTYSEEELDIMMIDIEIMKESGADGFVFGLVTPEGHVDVPNCLKLVKLCKNYPKTFHRAFDKVVEPLESMEEIIALGFERILTSGLKKTAEQGKSLIQELIDAARDRIIIMPGAGVTVDNVASILKTTGAKEFHGSAKVAKASHFITEEETVRKMLEMYRSILESRKAVETTDDKVQI